jgi:hypothetical protein
LRTAFDAARALPPLPSCTEPFALAEDVPSGDLRAGDVPLSFIIRIAFVRVPAVR